MYCRRGLDLLVLQVRLEVVHATSRQLLLLLLQLLLLLARWGQGRVRHPWGAEVVQGVGEEADLAPAGRAIMAQLRAVPACRANTW